MSGGVEQANASSSGWLKSGYGSAEIGLTAVEVMLQVYLLELYVSAGLNPIWAGGALAIAVIWDAVSDPVMGVVSDRTRSISSRGKRLPYMALGVPLVAVAFVFLYSPSEGTDELALFGRLLVWYLVLNTGMTLVIVPYLSLINDLAKGTADRAGFFGWRLFFSGAGLIVGLSIPAVLASRAASGSSDSDTAFLLANRSEAATWIAIVCSLATLLAMGLVWKRSGRAKALVLSEKGPSFFRMGRSAWRSRAFRYILLAFVFISLGRAVNASLALIFYKGTLRFSDEQVAVALIGLSLTVMAATPIWVGLARRFGKRRLSVGGSGVLAVLTAVAYPLMPPEAIGPVVFVVVAGGGAASSVVLLEALFSDVVEEDGRRLQQSLTGSYYGLWRMATKIARAGGLAVSGLFLGVIGYEKGNAEQAEGVLRSVAWAFGPGVAVFFGIGTWLLWREWRRNEDGIEGEVKL
ncbi:hypothetical protein VDG1235_825 [Verrucomicrobiia bacterium DG1235]|nr:hypothetical protein VDG1235_825 [Verrucomicrobiae bacterium DG1235]